MIGSVDASTTTSHVRGTRGTKGTRETREIADVGAMTNNIATLATIDLTVVETTIMIAAEAKGTTSRGQMDETSVTTVHTGSEVVTRNRNATSAMVRVMEEVIHSSIFLRLLYWCLYTLNLL